MKKKQYGRATRTEMIPIRFTPEEKMTVNRVALQRHDRPSTYLRRLILQHVDALMGREVPRPAGG